MIFYRLSYADIKKKLPQTQEDYDRKYARLKQDHGASAGANVVFSDTRKTIEFAIYGEDLAVYCKALRDELTTVFYVAGNDGTRNGDMEAAFITPEGIRRKAEILEQARDGLRDLPYQDPPPNTPPIDDALSALDNLKAIANASPKGLCFGGGHGDPDRNQLMQDLLNDPGHGGLSLFFIEELGVTDQPLVDDFLASPAGTPFPAELKNRVGNIKGLTEILVRLRDHNVANPGDLLKAYGINSSEAKSRPGSMGLENRVAMMNKCAKDVMEQAVKDNPGKKFMAFIGAAHANTHPGGIPGLAQIMGVPAIKQEGPKIRTDIEDKTLRGMPSKAEIRLIEAAVAELDKDRGFSSQQAEVKHARLQQLIGNQRAISFAKMGREERIARLQHLRDAGIAIGGEEEMAEQVVLDAEALVLASYPQDDDDGQAEVKASKHKELVKDLTAKLKALPPDKKQDKKALMTTLVDAVVGGPALGFYKKDKELRKGGLHVSVDVKAAKRSWLLKLQSF